MTDKYAVIGNPISHSKSPEIHTMFAAQFKGKPAGDISYEKIEAPLDGFKEKIDELRKKDFKGCNVTVPFKLEAWRLATSTTHALDAEAVNILMFESGEIFGDNTDGIGLVRDITQNLDFQIAGKRVLLMGTGGAASGVLHPLLDEKPQELVTAYRTLEKAQKIEKRIRGTAQFPVTSISFSSYSDLPEKSFDLIINATSTGLSDEMPPLPFGIFAPGALAYDMMYGRETPFMKFARAHGAAIVTDGLGMLVEQAAESFFIWRGVRPDTAPVIAALRAQQ